MCVVTTPRRATPHGRLRFKRFGPNFGVSGQCLECAGRRPRLRSTSRPAFGSYCKVRFNLIVKLPKSHFCDSYRKSAISGNLIVRLGLTLF